MIKPRLTVQNMKRYNPPTENRKGKLRLDFNENTIGCSPKVIEALKKATAEELSTYPEYGKFKEKLAQYLKLDPCEVIPTNGADEAIKLMMETYLERCDEVIIPTPTFAMFEVYASIIGAKITPVLYNKDLTFPTESLLNKINARTKLIVLVNPNNPTGTVINEADIVRIIEKAKNSIVLIDEAYCQYYKKSSKELIKSYDNLIVIQTFSKAFGLAGLRIGYVISNREIINNLQKAASPYSVNSVALIAANAALDDLGFVDNYIKEVRQCRRYVEAELNKLGLKTFPSEANFLIAYLGNRCSIICERLKEKNILVRNRTKDPLLKNCLRIGIGTSEQCERLVKALKDILREDVILFDLDGVLVDVSDSYRLAIKKTAELFTRQEIFSDEIQKFKEQGGYNNDWDLTEAIIRSKRIKIDKKKLISKFQGFYLGTKGIKGFIDNERWLLPKSILLKLYQNYRLGIVTGRPKEEAYYVLQKNGALDLFDVIITMQDCPKNKAKPDPFSINLALEKLGRKNAIYLGDSVDDMKAALNAGIEAIGIMPPNTPSDDLKRLLRQNGAKMVLGSISQIMEVLR